MQPLQLRTRACASAWLWALLLVAHPALAQSEADCPPVATPLGVERIQAGIRDARDHGFLWRISKGGRTSFLFGTVHVARLEWMFAGPRVVQALRASDTVALELDPLDPEVQRRLVEALRAAPAPELPAPLKQRLLRQMQAECLVPDALAGLSPEMQVATLITLSARRDGLDPAYGIDLFLAGYGHGAQKTVVSLETPELQAQALRMPTAQASLDVLEAGLSELEAGHARPSLNRIAQVWADADHAALAGYDEWCECRDTAADREAMKRLLDDRNPALAETIDHLHAGGKAVFAAVGSLHMVGPLGLPTLLAQRGYRVERVDFER